MIYHATKEGDVFNSRGEKLKPWPNPFGYLYVKLYNKNKYKVSSVHRFVWEYFNGEIPEKMTIDHINNNKQDNRLENLQVVSNKVNCRKKYNAKITMELAEEIRKRREIEGLVIEELSRQYGVSKTSIWNIIHNKTWND